METFYVCLTMDCENSDYWKSPGGWDMSPHAIRGFVDTLSDHGMKGNLFVVLENARRNPEAIHHAKEKGFEISLHIHTEEGGFTMGGKAVAPGQRWLTDFSYDEQVQILSQACDSWSRALGFRPMTFRAGCFCGNEDTYKALIKVGFKYGNIGGGQRNYPTYRSFWVGAPLHPYCPSEEDKLKEGRMPFLEIPCTYNPGKKTANVISHGESLVELRMGLGDTLMHMETIDAAIEYQIENGVKLKTVVSLTHDRFPYDDPNSAMHERLIAVAEYIKRAVEHKGHRWVPATFADIHDAFLKSAGAKRAGAPGDGGQKREA